MNKRDFLKGMVATAAGLMVPAHALAESKYEFHQRVAGLKPTGAAGPSLPVSSDGGVDWYGEVPASELIAGDQLATALGLSAGIAFNSDGGWLHVRLDGGPDLYIAKKPLRYSLTAAEAKAAGLYLGHEIEIGGVRYRVRNLEGVNQNATYSSNTTLYDPVETHGTEWNRIMYRLVNPSEIGSQVASDTTKSEGEYVPLASYSYAELGMSGVNGSLSITNVRGRPDVNAFFRGVDAVSNVHKSTNYTFRNAYRGWRPVLERM